MIYKYLSLKDKVRILLNRFIKVDQQFLSKKRVFDHLNINNISLKFVKGIFNFNFNGSDIFLRDKSSDFEVFEQVIINKEYEFATDLFKSSFNRDPKTLVDLGANIGLTSVYFNQLYPDIKILALEPENDNFELLNKNTASMEHINTIKKGVWNERKELKVSSDFRDKRAWAFQLDEEKGSQIIQTVKLIDLLENFEKQEVDILKVDIEGAEKQVLLEDKEIEKALEKVNLICLEIHDEIVSRIKITDKLIESGFKIYAKNETVFGVK